MRLAALKLGAGVPEADFSGTVRSVFRNACIVDVDGRPITVVPAAAGGLPAGISVESPAELDFEKEVTPGAGVNVRGGVLRIGDSGLSIDLRQALAWRSGLGELDLDLSHEPVRAAWQLAEEALHADGRHEILRSLARPAIESLAVAIGRRDVNEARVAMRPLVGLGAGGTPAGDDFLVGFLAALWSSHNARRSEFVEHISAEAKALSGRTNDVSRVYLEAAAEGEVSERLSDLAGAIALGATAGVVLAATAAIAVGHTSGADGTFGLLTGAEAVAHETAAVSRS